MKLDDIEKLIALATPGPWPSEFGRCDYPEEGSMACGPIIRLDEDEDGLTDEDEECRRAQADQDFICMSRELMPKLLKIVQLIKEELDLVLEAHRSDRADEIVRLLAELEQP